MPVFRLSCLTADSNALLRRVNFGALDLRLLLETLHGDRQCGYTEVLSQPSSTMSPVHPAQPLQSFEDARRKPSVTNARRLSMLPSSVINPESFRSRRRSARTRVGRGRLNWVLALRPEKGIVLSPIVQRVGRLILVSRAFPSHQTAR